MDYEINKKINSNQKEYILWHYKLGHVNIIWVKLLMNSRTYVYEYGIEVSSELILEIINKTTNKFDLPICENFQLGKDQIKNDTPANLNQTL